MLQACQPTDFTALIGIRNSPGIFGPWRRLPTLGARRMGAASGRRIVSASRLRNRGSLARRSTTSCSWARNRARRTSSAHRTTQGRVQQAEPLGRPISHSRMHLQQPSRGLVVCKFTDLFSRYTGGEEVALSPMRRLAWLRLMSVVLDQLGADADEATFIAARWIGRTRSRSGPRPIHGALAWLQRNSSATYTCG